MFNFHDDIYKKSIESCSPTYAWSTSQWMKTGRGTAILDSNEACNIYNKYYAGRHKAVLDNQYRKLFTSTSKNNFSNDIVINDFGAGQGFGSIVFIEKLIANKIKCNRLIVNLIEPSIFALNKAQYYIKNLITRGGYAICNNYEINKINKKLEDLHCINSLLKTKKDYTNINIFANIIDVPTINIQKLLHDLKSIESKNDFYICNSPTIYIDNRMQNLESFYYGLNSESSNRQKIIIENYSKNFISSPIYYFKGNHNPSILQNKTHAYLGFILKKGAL